MASETSVRVCVRVRPLIPKERLEDEHLAVETFDSQIKVASQTFTFDHVFGLDSGQEDIWPCVTPLVDSVFEGYNATIFAYGQTGSGKTFTMGSGNSAFVSNPDERGIIPRVLQEMFARIAAKTADGRGYRTELKLRFLEIYGEEIRDLLSQFGNGTLDTSSKVNLKEIQNGQVQVQGAREEDVHSADECIRLLDKGTYCRTTGATEMNSESSRSHAILTLTMVQYIPYDTLVAKDGDENAAPEYDVRCCYFNFVDLAGSEKQKMTKAEGQRLKEGIDINKGLFVLGCVINALGDDTKRGRVHVPYRDSKLTRMLQDSLGGNSRTLMVCCVSPAGKNVAETKSSLSYANRARNIQNKAVVNRDEQSSIVAELRQQIQSLEGELFAFRHPGADMSDPQVQAAVATSDWRLDSFSSLRRRTEGAESEVMRLTGELKRWRTEMDAMKEELLATQAQRDYFRLCGEELKQQHGGGVAGSAEMGVIQEHLRTIQDLQDRLRQAETDRDKAHAHSASSGTLDFASFGLFSADAVQDEQRLIEKAEQEIKRENELLKQLQSNAVAMPPPAPASTSRTTGTVPSMALSSAGPSAADDDEPVGDDMDDTVDPPDEDDTLEASAEASSEMAELQREFQQRQQVLGATVQDLSNNISLKEQMLQTLRRNAEGYERMRGVFEARVIEMADKERSYMAERDQLTAELDKMQHQTSDPRYQRLSSELQNKDGELGALRKKQAEMKRFETIKQKSDVQLRVLTNEITAMKKQKVDLLKKMQGDRKKYELEASERKREILTLKRAHLKDKQQILKLGSEKNAQERVLKRRVEEVAAANRRLKQQQLLLSANAKKKPLKRFKSKDEEWLADQIQKLSDKQKKSELLEKELDKREKIVQQMERLHGMRSKLQSELKASMDERNGSNIRDILISPFKQHLEASTSQQTATTAALSKDEEAMLAELEDRIEACQTQLEYKNERISEMTTGQGDNDQGDPMVKVENSSLPEARTLLKLLFKMAVEVKSQEQSKEAELERAALRVDDLQKHLRMERERNSVMRQTYEEKLQKMIADAMTEPDDGLKLVRSAVEERNAILRKRCEELELHQLDWQRQTQQLVQRNAKYQQSMGTCRERIKWLETQLNATKRGDAGNDEADDEDHPVMDDGDDELFGDTMSVGSASSDSTVLTTTHGPSSTNGGADGSTSSIFNRLANPNNFTGIHRHRLQENAMIKREEIKSKGQQLRSRRLKDRNVQAAPLSSSKLRQPNASFQSPRARTPRPRTASEDFGTYPRSSAVLDVLATMKRGNEGDGGLDELELDEGDHSDTMSEGGYGMDSSPRGGFRGKKEVDTMSEGSPRASSGGRKKDVFSRLNGQYTASAQSKRQVHTGLL
ncbi:hypothetical protein, variant 1 [Aphanomyces astaci]|uniref:Kinesin motor domain-containing protein n=2 Tax=Aphanomyces astaci TaxID=112090 RepID=W4G4U0_APHAT|nr:hypothetical protein, variant 1 [Aphanomyces astaci]ETV74690.1 hypothetical protein, variant 1 [Aphanomyces astaci]|eukprot:XP_009835777.1 hypothetical protein, variant 1 [Aphanomyces astaci]